MAPEKKAAVHHFNEDLENRICQVVVDSEAKTSEANQGPDIADYEAVIDMLECVRTEKNYEWMSDVFIPELPSIMLTDAGGWANQYFQSRAFVDCILEETVEGGLDKARAAKRLINNTLNRRDLYYFHKYVRGRTINAAIGRVFAVCWWDREEDLEETGEVEEVPTGVDQFGNEVEDMSLSLTATQPVLRPKIKRDCFNFEVIDPANVFTDGKYVYSVQDKDWITIRSEKSYYELIPLQGDFGYINLDILKELDEGGDETEAAKKSYNYQGVNKPVDDTPIQRWDIYERYGKYWVVEGKDGVEPGVDDGGKPLDGAELAETVITIAVRGSSRVLIRFQKQKNVDASGRPYRPIIRGLCYIHPRRDEGLADGKYLKESQVAINDNFNLGMDRVKLATLPTLIGRKYALQDNETIYFEPEHVMEVDDPTTDLKELQISDDIKGTIDMNYLLASKMQQVSSVYPTTMGDLPAASNTATAVAGAESRANLRSNYKSLTFENTFLLDLYTIIMNMTYQYATPETMQRLMGDDAQFFDPDQDYSFLPVSSNIEMEASKDRKMQRYDQMLGRLAPFAQNPKIFMVVNFILAQMLELQGNEMAKFRKMLLDERPPTPEGDGSVQGGTQVADMTGEATSNQSGMPMSQQEGMVRGQFGGMPGGGGMSGTY